MKPETKTEPNVKQAVPFFWVSSIEESVRSVKDMSARISRRE